MEKKLQEVREWAKSKIASGQEPPWAWYQYMKLVETVDAILAGQGCISPTGNLQQSDAHQGMRLRLVDSTYRQDSVQHHQDTLWPQMPM